MPHEKRTSTTRTSTTKWKRLRARLLRQAVRNGTFVCVECRTALDPDAPPHTPMSAELDHVIPFAERPDLEHDPSNLVWRCHPCNRRKGRGADAREVMPMTRRW